MRALLPQERRITWRGAARQNEPVASETEGFVPSLRKGGNQFVDTSPANANAGVHDFPPSVDASAFQGKLLKSHPLGHRDTDGVINPSHFLSWDACGNYVVDDGMHGPENFNLKPASGFPGVAVYPAQFAINIGEVIPAMNIGKNKPGKSRTGFSNDGIFKS